MTDSLQAASAALTTAAELAWFPMRELAGTEPEYLNGTKVTDAVRDVREALNAVDAAERELLLAIVAAGVPPTVAARRCGFAPATVTRWLAEVTE